MSQATGQSVQSDILDAVVAALGGQAQNVWRTRFRPFGAEELPSDNVVPEDVQDFYEANDDLDRKHRFVVRHLAAATDAVDKAVDLRYVRAQRLLLADPTLGGLVRYTREIGCKWEFESASKDTVALAVTYEVEFSTSRSDPSVPGF
jgi:hypothetical protein